MIVYLDTSQYDTALLSNVLEHIEDDRAAVRKARSELRMDGTLLIFVPAFGLLMRGLDHRLGTTAATPPAACGASCSRA